MTDKMTIEQAIICLDFFRTDNPMVDRSERLKLALEVAIEALRQNAKLKMLIERYYILGEQPDIDHIACKYCEHKIDGRCEFPDDNGCVQTNGEALELFWKYGLGE